MVCRRGKLPFADPRNVRSVQKWAVAYTNNGGKRHSQKPEAAMDLIEIVSPGPYVELFARRHRMGWDVWGDQSANTAEMEAA
jgi:N6-adenosine-specific RNA methylase IME4